MDNLYESYYIGDVKDFRGDKKSCRAYFYAKFVWSQVNIVLLYRNSSKNHIS